MSARSLRASLLFLVPLVLLVAVPSAHAKGPGGGGGKGTGLVLTDTAVVPGPGDMGATATAVLSVAHGQVCFTITESGLSGVITQIALYQAPAGQAGPMVLQLTPSPIGLYQLNDCVPADPTLVRAIQRNPSAYYIQINTSMYPAGALRAQLQ